MELQTIFNIAVIVGFIAQVFHNYYQQKINKSFHEFDVNQHKINKSLVEVINKLRKEGN